MVLIVNRDLGFVFWLGKLFSEAGREALPARNVRQAKLLLRQISSRVDVLVIDPVLPGTAAFAKSMQQANPRLLIVEALARPLAPAHYSLPTHATPEMAEAWLDIAPMRPSDLQ